MFSVEQVQAQLETCELTGGDNLMEWLESKCEEAIPVVTDEGDRAMVYRSGSILARITLLAVVEDNYDGDPGAALCQIRGEIAVLDSPEDAERFVNVKRGEFLLAQMGGGHSPSMN